MPIRSVLHGNEDLAPCGDVMQTRLPSFRSLFRAPSGQLVSCSLLAAAPGHAVMCRLKDGGSWFVNHAYVDRQTAEEDVAKQRSTWEAHAIDYVIVEREATDLRQFGND